LCDSERVRRLVIRMAFSSMSIYSHTLNSDSHTIVTYISTHWRIATGNWLDWESIISQGTRKYQIDQPWMTSDDYVPLLKNPRLNKIVQELSEVFGGDAYNIPMTETKQRYLICRRDSMTLDLWHNFMPIDCEWYADCRPHNEITSFRLSEANGGLQKRELEDDCLNSDDAYAQWYGLLLLLRCGFKSYE
jgi:hypothetical protein